MTDTPTFQVDEPVRLTDELALEMMQGAIAASSDPLATSARLLGAAAALMKATKGASFAASTLRHLAEVAENG